MAIAVNYQKVLGHSVLNALLLDAVTATGNGEWVDASGFYILTFDVVGITTATVDLRYSNAPTRPSNASHERQIEDMTADGLVVVSFPVRWVKARVSAYTSGTISVYLTGNQPS